MADLAETNVTELEENNDNSKKRKIESDIENSPKRQATEKAESVAEEYEEESVEEEEYDNGSEASTTNDDQEVNPPLPPSRPSGPIPVTTYSAPPVSKPELPPNEPTPLQDSNMNVKMRFLVSSREAGVVIGKGGSRVSEIREATGMKIMVTPHIQGVSDRVMTMSGPLHSLGRAVSMIAKNLILKSSSDSRKNQATFRLLVPSSKMGYVIGKGGSRIKELQQESGTLIQSDPDNLPNTSERVMTLIGSPDSLQLASYTLGSFIGDFLELNPDANLYDPSLQVQNQKSPQSQYSQQYYSSTNSYPTSSAQQAAAFPASYLPQLQLLAAQYPQLLQAQYQQYYSQASTPNSAITSALNSLTDTSSGAKTESTSQYFAQPQSYSQTNTSANPQTSSYYTDQNNQSTSSSALANLALLQAQYQNYYSQTAAQGGQSAATAYNQTQSYGNNQSFANYNQEMAIPSQYVGNINLIEGNIIGKGGANIKELRSTTGCQV